MTNHKTAIFKDDLFLRHNPGPGHPESPKRLSIIYDQLKRPEIKKQFIFPPCQPAAREILALNHSKAYITRVEATAGKTSATLDPDTRTSPHSCDAAKLAAGATVTATQLVITKEIKNGFVLARPPGHHAEADQSSGFCLFNNIAIAARYALKKLKLKRILIIDWDLHHGNGTQNSFYDTDKVLYFSTHQYPYFPGSGGLNETGQGDGKGFTINVPLSGGQGDQEFANIFHQLLVPLAREYKPEIIMVSAGFDTYHGDPLGTMNLSVDGFAYMTKVLRDLAVELCNSRIIMVLEGGYNLVGLKNGILASLAELNGHSTLTTDTIKQLQKSSLPFPELECAINNTKNYWTF